MNTLAQRVAALFLAGKPGPELVSEALKAGEKAFAEGKKRIPAHDSVLHKLLESGRGQPVGWSTSLLDAWLKGWDKANLAAPVSMPSGPGVHQLNEEQVGFVERLVGPKSDPNMPRLERIVDSMEHEVKDLKSALEKYKSDPEKYKPQLQNMVSGAHILGSDVRALLRTLGTE